MKKPGALENIILACSIAFISIVMPTYATGCGRNKQTERISYINPKLNKITGQKYEDLKKIYAETKDHDETAKIYNKKYNASISAYEAGRRMNIDKDYIILLGIPMK